MTDLSRAHLFLAALTLLTFLPFLNRAVFVDDHAHVVVARRLMAHPWDPYPRDGSGMIWKTGEAPMDANPPLHSYVIGTAMRAFGPELWKLHLLMILFHLLSIFGFFGIATRFTRHPLFASLLWLWTPHFWITGNSLLVDGMITSFLLPGLALWMAGWDKKSPGQLILGGILLGLAPLVKYTAVLGIGLAAVWSALHAREARHWMWTALLAPATVFGSWLMWTRALYGESHFSATAHSSMVLPSLPHLATFFMFLIGTSPVLLAGGIVLLTNFRKMVFPKNSRCYFLLIWLAMASAGLLTARGWFCARYFVVIGPAAILLMLSLLENAQPAFLHLNRMVAVTILCVATTGLLAWADLRQANVDRDAAAWLNHWAQSDRPERKRYYSGALLSGLSFYLDSDLWTEAAPQQVLEEGSAVVLPWRSLPRAFFPAIKEPKKLDQKQFDVKIPLRTLDGKSGAGFYGSVWGPWPFSVSREPAEVYTLVEVQ